MNEGENGEVMPTNQTIDNLLTHEKKSSKNCDFLREVIPLMTKPTMQVLLTPACLIIE
jgi:hypothetical protein